MGKTIITVIILAVVLAACSSGGDSIVIKKAESVQLKQVDSVSMDGQYLMAMADTDGTYFIDALTPTGPNPDAGVIEIRNSQMDVVSTLTIRRGKGPGEVLFPAFVKLLGDEIYILDGTKRSIEIFDYQGNYKDTILLNGSFSIFKWITPLVKSDKGIAVAPVLPDLLVRFDNEGEVIGSVPSWLKDNTDGRMWQEHASRITGDPDGNLYLSFNEDKFEIRKYDSSLNLVWAKKIVDETTPAPGMTMVVIGDSKQPVGTFVHSSFFYDEGKLYMLRGIGGEIKDRMNGRQRERYSQPINGLDSAFIDVFNAENGDFIRRIKAPFVRTDRWAEVVKIGDAFFFNISQGRGEDEEEDKDTRPDNIIIKAVVEG
ncbi:MAG TPA: hypothetical protein PLJ93_02750 [Candidatus Mcinerneyibacteriales bacterium]|nr:hypothetical protein [Candidatus Mcinerneyibacteriales bacterium]